VATPEFKKTKEYLLDKKRFEKTEMFSQEKEFKKLKKNPDILWYFKIRIPTNLTSLRAGT